MNHYQKLLRQNKLPKQTEPAQFFQETAVNLDEEFSANKTLLQNAIMEQDEDLFNAIMEISKECETKPPDVNVPDRTRLHWTALHHAVFNSATNGEQMVIALLRAGANPNIEDTEGKVPLNIAVEMGNMEVVGLLIKSGARVNMGGSLLIALVSDKLDIFSFLLKQEDIDLEYTDEEGNTALHLAARLGYPDAIKELLEKTKAKDLVKRLFNLQNKSGNTPLHEAVMESQEEAEKLLRSIPEVDTQMKNKKGKTPQEVKEDQEREKEAMEKEEELNELRKRKKQETKRTERVVLGEKARRLIREEEEEETQSTFSKPWVKCIIFSVILAVVLYAFFYFYISRKQVPVKLK